MPRESLDGSPREALIRIRAAPARLGAVRMVAIDGPSGSGKTFFAARLAEALRLEGLRVVTVPTDDFATWDEPVQWWPRLVSGVLDPLRRGHPGRYQRIEWPGGEPAPGSWVTVEVPEVLVVEGVSSARCSVAPLLSVAVWVEVPDRTTRLERAVARDGTQARPFLERWQEFERQWFTVDRTRERSDVVIDGPALSAEFPLPTPPREPS